MDDKIKDLSESFFELKLSVSDLCSEVLNLATENEDLKKQIIELKNKNMELVTLLDNANQSNEDLKNRVQSYMFGSVVD
jgi:hypothetical protein